MKIAIYLLVPLALVTAACFSGNDHSQHGSAVKAIAQNRLNASLIALTAREAKCQDKANILPADLFSTLKLPIEQRKIALEFHYLKSLVHCSADAVNQYLLQSAILVSLNDKRSSAVQESNKLVLYQHIALLELESQYQAIPQEDRLALEAMPALSKPFLLLESTDALGL